MQYNIIYFDALESTNDEANKVQYKHCDVIVARSQTKGRGQRGNKWSATKGLNLTCTLVVEPSDISVYQQFRISQIAAMAASDALRVCGAECKVKWPNDLYVGNRKIGGILIEHTSMGPDITKSIIGIGININQEQFPEDLPNPTSLRMLGLTLTIDVVLHLLLEKFTARYTQQHCELHRDYMNNLWAGTGNWRDEDGEFCGHIADVDCNTGMLTICRDDNKQKEYYFKEVEYKL